MKILGFDISRLGSGPVSAHRIEPQMMAAGDTSGTKNPQAWLSEIGWGGSAASRVKGLPRATPAALERHATVFACCNNIAGDLSKVPVQMWQRSSDGTETKVDQHPASYLLNVESTPGVPARLVRFALIYAYTLRGQATSYGPRDGGGELLMIDLIDQNTVQILKHGRDRWFDFEDGAGVQRRAPARSMVHLRYMAADGWTGRSPLQVAADSTGLAMAGQDAAARNASGTTVKAVIKLDDFYESDGDRERNARRVKDAITNPLADGMPILGPGEDVKSLDLSAADQELLSSRKFDREQLAAIYRMPPSKLQMLEFGVKANGQQQAIDYRTDCLMHWGGLAEDQMAATILTEEEKRKGLFLKHDFSRLLQPTTKEHYDALHTAVGGPFMTANTAQRLANLPLTEGEDDNRLNPAANMTRNETKPQKGAKE